MENPPIVDPADVALDEAGADERERDAQLGQLRCDRVGERAQGELAHRVRRHPGHCDPTRDTASDNQLSARADNFRQRRIQRAQHPEDVGLELAAVVRER